MISRLFAIAVLVAVPVSAVAAESHGGHRHPGPASAPYAGQDARAASSLSEDDLAALRAGAGWGLAKPAELRGYPGPRHVLDLAPELALTEEQRARIERIFARMNEAARALGAELIAAEQALDELFEAGEATPALLKARLADAGRVRTELRHVHLAAHLEVMPILTRHQRHVYASLRGYGGAQ